LVRCRASACTSAVDQIAAWCVVEQVLARLLLIKLLLGAL